jgi:hypothetical protein
MLSAPGNSQRSRLHLLGVALLKWLSPIFAVVPLRLSTVLRLSGPDKEQKHGHHYGYTYQRLFWPWKYRRLRLLEIGVGGGNLVGRSLLAWRYYFPFARIVGCDIVDKRNLSGGGLHIHIVDQSSAADLARINSEEGPFNIIIDDGSHINRHQIFSFEQLFPRLAPGGIYVIEDTQTSYWPNFGGAPVDQQSRETAMGYFTELARYLNYPEFPAGQMGDSDMLASAKSVVSICFEHNLIILRKSQNLPSQEFGCPAQTDPPAARTAL